MRQRGRTEVEPHALNYDSVRLTANAEERRNRDGAREWLGRLALATLGTASALLVAELALRLVHYRPERHRTRNRVTNAADLKVRAGALVLDCYPSDERGYFDIDLRRPADFERYSKEGVQRLGDMAREFPVCVEFRYNEVGYRDRPFGPRRPDVVRVAVVGDSFTEAQGVRESDGFARLLEAGLARQHPGRVEVLNFGRRAEDLPALFRMFEQAETYAPDLIVYAMVLNDGVRTPEYDRAWPKLNDWIMVRRPDEPLGPWNSRLAALVKDQLEARRIDALATRWYAGMYGPENETGWNQTRDYLRRMGQTSRDRGQGLLVVLWPLLTKLEGRYPFEDVHTRLGRVCAREHIEFLDGLSVLRGLDSRSLWVHPADLHPNEIAHRLLAEATLPRLEALLAGRFKQTAQPQSDGKPSVAHSSSGRTTPGMGPP